MWLTAGATTHQSFEYAFYTCRELALALHYVPEVQDLLPDGYMAPS